MPAASRPPVGRNEGLTAAVVICALLLSRLHSYLLFHTLSEIFTLVVGFTVFTVAWNTRRQLDDPVLLGIGITLAPVAMTLALHALAYKGLGVFADHGANLATQLWVVSRLLLAIGVVAAALPERARVPPGRLLCALVAIGAGLCLAIFTGAFPDCYVEGRGLTPFKIGVECVMMAALALVALKVWRDDFPRDPHISQLIMGALWLQVAASGAFTIYQDVYGALNMAGHVLAISSGMAIYAAVAWKGLAEPQAIFYGQLSRTRDQFADAADRATGEIDDFAHVLAHHLQEPVRLQYSYSQRLERLLPMPLTAEQSEALGYVRAGALRLRALLRDVQLYLSVGRLPVAPRPCKAAAAANGAMSRLSERIRSERAEVTCGSLPIVLADNAHLTDLFMILVENSLSYRRPDVPPRITITAEESNGQAVISVTDNGQGIAADLQQRVFKVFERGSAEDGTGGGTGIGLAVAKKIVEQAQGRIWLETPEDGGTRACFTLPLASG